MRDKERESYERKKSIKSPIGDLIDANRRVSFGKSEFYRADSVKSENSINSEEYREAAAGFTSEILEKSVENELYHEKSIEITENVLQKAYAENLETFSRQMSPEKSRKNSRPSTAESRIQSASKSTPIESETSELSLKNENQDKIADQRRPESGKRDVRETEETNKSENATTNQTVVGKSDLQETVKNDKSEVETMNQAQNQIKKLENGGRVESIDSKEESVQSQAENSKRPELSTTESDGSPKVTEDFTNETTNKINVNSKQKDPKGFEKAEGKAQDPGFWV